MGGPPLTDQAFDTIFRKARTANGWLDKPVGDDVLQKIYDDMKFGPTSANSCPLRIVFLKSKESKERLKSFLMESNQSKVMTSPVTAILAWDVKFYDQLPKLFPHADARSWFVGNDQMIYDTAFRNSSLQAAYFMIAARAHGLDCGPMSGYDQAKADAEFFPGGEWKSNFICALGYGDEAKLFPRNPRLGFDEACKIL
ncbi:MAG TPA: malonic semialdehyde reductase [Patescibacteria group bacterium]|nr:malonic semialdehyde reductase [Patescibacteria group bacterium]